MVKFKFFVGWGNDGYYNSHFADDEADAKRIIEKWNRQYENTKYHVDLVSIKEITMEEFAEDYITPL